MRISLVLMLIATAAGIGASGCSHPERRLGPSDLVPHQSYNLPPAQMLMEPGPGVGGPGPGVLSPVAASGPVEPAAYHGAACGPDGTPLGAANSQFAFVEPAGMTVLWDVRQRGMFDSQPLVVPGRQNFRQAAIYRLKLINIPGRAGVELYPTLEVGPTTPRTVAYLSHNAIPIQFTDEDLEQVLSGNFVSKVIYLPDPEFQDLALSRVETLVSTRLDPGQDPIVEADRRGAILAIVRVGNKDLQIPNAAGGALLDESVTPVEYQGAQSVGGYTDGGYGDSQGGYPSGGTFAAGPIPDAALAQSSQLPNYISGVSGPQYGMPITGTPIGLPGPPHIPLGVPAGLKKHVIRNRTHNHIPTPREDFRINVRQRPGYSYPRPVTRVNIDERVHAPNWHSHNPAWNRHQLIQHPANGPGY